MHFFIGLGTVGQDKASQIYAQKTSHSSDRHIVAVADMFPVRDRSCLPIQLFCLLVGFRQHSDEIRPAYWRKADRLGRLGYAGYRHSVSRSSNHVILTLTDSDIRLAVVICHTTRSDVGFYRDQQVG